jgi:hypothetical protein
MSFEENRGQAPADVRFLTRAGGFTFLVTGDGGRMRWLSQCPARQQSPAAAEPCVPGREDESITMRIGAAGKAAASSEYGEAMLPGKVNYLLGSDPSQWRTGLATYARVRRSNAYPGIDLVYYGNGQRLEYDFVVRPGSDPSAIAIRFNGQKSLRLADDGSVEIAGEHGSMQLRKPVIFQQEQSRRVPVEGAFILAANGEIRLKLGSYDRRKTLVIDPVLSYSTYLAGSAGSAGTGIAVDAAGSAYATGYTTSSDFPTTSGAFETSASTTVAYVSKFNAAGTALVYSTFLGGSSYALATAIAIDASHSAYIVGETAATDFPTTCGAFQTTNNAGARAAFAAKLSVDGSSLIYATYLTGSSAAGYTNPLALALDGSGNAYIAGATTASDYPVTHGSFQQVNNAAALGLPNAFVTKLNSAGTGLVYSTYLGGSSSLSTAGDVANGIAVDSAGHAFVAGGTTSNDFPVTPGAFQSTSHSVAHTFVTGFVTEFDTSGSTLVYSTYLGGSSADYVNAIAIDSSGNAYVAGSAQSSDFPLTSGAFEGSDYASFVVGGIAGFVTKLNSGGASLGYSTLIMGSYFASPDLMISALAVDSSGRAYFGGLAGIPGFPATADALPMPSAEFETGYVMKLNAAGSALDYSSMLAGSNGPEGHYSQVLAVAVDPAGSAYFTGQTYESDFPTTAGALQTTDPAPNIISAFVSKFALAGELNEMPAPALPGPTGTTVTLDQGSFEWVSCPVEYSISLSAYVIGDDSSLPNEGTMSFSVSDGQNGASLPEAPVLGGYAQSSADLTGGGIVPDGGPYFVSACYSGSGRYSGSCNGFPPNSLNAPDCDEFSMRKQSARRAHRELLPPASGPTQAVLRGGRATERIRLFTGHVARFDFHPPATPQPAGVRLETARPEVVRPDASSSCPLTPLVVTLHPATRYYGAANPPVLASYSPTLNANTLTAVNITSATTATPVGTYPLSATIEGPSIGNYSPITVKATVLYVRPEPLYLFADSYRSTYGQTPPAPTGYYFSGFVNGEGPGVVTGAPVLSTSVTAATPVGYYPIATSVGTLASSNYKITAAAQPGVINVQKALLILKPNNVTIHRGDPIPALTYTLTNFVNGDLPSVVSGSPYLLVQADSTSRPGTYPIYVAKGSLYAANYDFTPQNGTITILP